MTSKSSSQHEPKIIKKLATAVYPSFAMLAGMQLDVFSPLKNGPMSTEQIAEALNLESRKIKPLLYALAAAELLTMKGNKFSNTNEANEFLVRDSDLYIGDHAYINTICMWGNWGAALTTADSIQMGIPQAYFDFANLKTNKVDGKVHL